MDPLMVLMMAIYAGSTFGCPYTLRIHLLL